MATEISQAIYDDTTFFESYAQLPRSQNGLSAAPEWGALKRMVGNVQGKKAIDLGCGYGWFCRWAHESGASSVTGVDISERMLSRAEQMSPGDAITYQLSDITNIELIPGIYDLVYSSLALHYLAEIDTLFRSVFLGLKPGGRFVFSLEHPTWTATDGWFITKDGDLPIWPLNQYADEGKRNKKWLGSNVVKYHRKLDTYVSSVLKAGFIIRDLVEWTPSKEDLEAHPEWSMEVHRPAFLLMAVERP
jgi:SAM-dependent methyltransferase